MDIEIEIGDDIYNLFNVYISPFTVDLSPEEGSSTLIQENDIIAFYIMSHSFSFYEKDESPNVSSDFSVLLAAVRIKNRDWIAQKENTDTVLIIPLQFDTPFKIGSDFNEDDIVDIVRDHHSDRIYDFLYDEFKDKISNLISDAANMVAEQLEKDLNNYDDNNYVKAWVNEAIEDALSKIIDYESESYFEMSDIPPIFIDENIDNIWVARITSRSEMPNDFLEVYDFLVDEIDLASKALNDEYLEIANEIRDIVREHINDEDVWKWTWNRPTTIEVKNADKLLNELTAAVSGNSQYVHL